MPYLMRGNGGAATGAASYTDEIFCEVFEFDLLTNKVSKIQERFVFQDLIKKNPTYMQMLK